MRRILFVSLLLAIAAWAQDGYRQLSYFVDPFGNAGSFWAVTHAGKPYTVLKLKSPDVPGEANFAFNDGVLSEFEKKVTELHKMPNPLKSDGFQVVWSTQFGDASVRTLVGRMNGVKLKVIQIEQKPEGGAKAEHQVSIDQCYSEFTSALRKARKKK